MVSTLYNVITYPFSGFLTPTPDKSKPPCAPTAEQPYGRWGDVNIDPYSYMQNPDDARTKQYVTDARAHTEATLKPYAPLIDELNKEMASRQLETKVIGDVRALCQRIGDYDYFFEENTCYRVKFSTDSPPEPILTNDEILLCCGPYADAGAVFPSRDGRYVVFVLDMTGAQGYSLFIKDVQARTVLGDEIPNTTGDVVWMEKGNVFCYVEVDAVNGRPSTAKTHTVGTPFARDKNIYFEEDEHFNLNIKGTENPKYFFLISGNFDCSEARLMCCDALDKTDQILSNRTETWRYEPLLAGDKIYIRFSEAYSNFELFQAPLNSPSTWSDTNIDCGDITDMTLLKDYLVLTVRGEYGPEFIGYHLATGTTKNINLGKTHAYEATAHATCASSANRVIIKYSDPLTPPVTLCHDFQNNETSIISHQVMQGDVDPSQFTMTREYTDTDPRIAIDLVYDKKITNLRQGNPMVVTAYGAYGDSYDPGFEKKIFSLLKRGVVYAIAHPRGGGERGQQWYFQGKRQLKKNTFDDFDACLRHLVDKGFTRRETLAATATSAGGFMLGYQITRDDPVATCFVVRKGWTNVLQDMLEWRLFLTVTEMSEWGNPENKLDYYNLKELSPQLRITEKAYPAIMSIAAKYDSNVPTEVEERWTAALQASQTGDQPILLQYETSGGHDDDPANEFGIEYGFIIHSHSMVPGGLAVTS